MLTIDQYSEIIGDENATTVIYQNGQPVDITSYRSIYVPDLDIDPEGIMHCVKYKNISCQHIVAIKFGIAAFDAFNHLLESFTGISIEDVEENEDVECTWNQRCSSPWLYKKYGTGVVYVEVVRFGDGTFWYSDKEKIIFELQKFEKDLTKDDLKK